MDTDPNFLIYRKFGWLRNYVLLELQDEIAQLEDRLLKHDEREKNNKRLRSRRLDTPLEGNRHDLISNLQKSLSEYGESNP